nr:ribonuclease H-like domain, reverse transcriptase, RNA-dependent DNA polymerase [Tanacetum cinerariifolium]
MDQDLVHMVATSKVPMLKQENGNAPLITQVVEGVETTIAPATTDEKGTKKQYENFTPSTSEVLDQTFDRLQKLISQLEIHGESISQEDVNQKFLRRLSPEWNTHIIVWRNKPEIDTLSLDDLYNALKIYETEGIMRTMRFLKNTGRKFSLNGNETIGFDMSKVECYNCHKKGHFAREYRALLSLDTKHKESTRRTVPMETPASTTLVSCDDLGSYHWSDQAEDGPTNFALMAYSSVSSKSEIIDKCKIGLGYNAVPPPYTGNFLPLKPNLSGLEEFVNEPIVNEPTVKKHAVETSEAKASADKPKDIRKNFGPLLIKDWISDSEDETKSKSKIEKETVKPRFAKIKFVKSKEQGNPQTDLQDKGVIDSRYLRHMTGNVTYLINYKEIDRGYVAFGGNPKGGKITKRGTIKTGKLDFENVYFVRELKFNLFSVSQICDKKNIILFNDTECIVLSLNVKLTDESQVLLRVPRKNNMYSVDLKNIIPKEGLTCLFAKATSNESKLWHRRLGHYYKTMNKLVKENLVRDHKVKVIRCDNGIEFKNKEMNQCCEMKGTKACDDVGKARMELQPSSDDGKKIDEDPRQERECKDQEKEDNVNALEDISTFNLLSDQEDADEEVNINNMEITIQIEEELYLCQPLRFEDIDFPDKVHKVEKALYGLHQAPRAWCETLSTYLLDNGFHRGKIDKTLFIRRHKDDIFLVQVYVDDIIFGSTKKELCNAFEKIMHEQFQMSSMGKLAFFLGLQVKQKQDGIFINQDKYVAEILKKYSFSKVKNASLLMETQKPLLKDEDGEEVDVHMYRSIIGSLMYLTSSRLDIMFAVCACARYQQFWATVKAKTVNGEGQLQALVDGKKVLITESTIRSDLQLDDAEGVDCLPNLVILEQLTLMGKSRKKDTELPQTSVPTSVVDEAVNEDIDDSLERAATTATSLDAEQDRGVNTPRSGEDSLKLIELMKLCTKLQQRVLDLETTKTTQAMAIESLKRRVKKLEMRNRLRTHRHKRLYKGMIADIDANEDITLVNTHDEQTFDADQDLGSEEVFVAQQEEKVVEKEVNATQVQVTTTATTTPIISIDESTLAQALLELKHEKPKTKAKWILNEEVALKLQAQFDKEQRLAEERAQQEVEANIALIESWDDVQAKIDANYQLAKRLQDEEQ